MSFHRQMLEKPFANQTNEIVQELITGLRRGDQCPQCKQGRLEYDGLLNLSCSQCGYTNLVGGSFT